MYFIVHLSHIVIPNLSFTFLLFSKKLYYHRVKIAQKRKSKEDKQCDASHSDESTDKSEGEKEKIKKRSKSAGDREAR